MHVTRKPAVREEVVRVAFWERFRWALGRTELFAWRTNLMIGLISTAGVFFAIWVVTGRPTLQNFIEGSEFRDFLIPVAVTVIVTVVVSPTMQFIGNYRRSRRAILEDRLWAATEEAQRVLDAQTLWTREFWDKVEYFATAAARLRHHAATKPKDDVFDAWTQRA